MAEDESKSWKVLKAIAVVFVAVSLLSIMIGYLYLDSLALDDSIPPDSVVAEP